MIITWTIPRTGCSAPRSAAIPHTQLPGWTAGNLAEPLVHGSTYFDRLVDEVQALNAGDHLFFTDWRGDPDELLRDDGPTVAELFTDAVKRGVCVRGLVWRSHMAPDVAEQGGQPLAGPRDRARRRAR